MLNAQSGPVVLGVEVISLLRLAQLLAAKRPRR